MASTVVYINLAPRPAFIGSDSRAAARRAASLLGLRMASRVSTASLMRSRILRLGRSSPARIFSISASTLWEKNSIRDCGPSGNSRARAALSAPASLPAFVRTFSVKPSKAASFKAAASTACFNAASSGFLPSADFDAGFLRAFLDMALSCGGDMADFRFKDQFGKVAHAAGIKPPIQMIDFMLHHPGVKAARHPLDRLSVQPEAAIAYMGRTFDKAAQTRHRQAAFPAPFQLRPQNRDLGVDQAGQGGGVVEFLVLGKFGVRALSGGLENHQPEGNMDLGGGQTRAIGV